MSCNFSIKTFDELTAVDVYQILKARAQVFIVEQNCAYQDIDEADFDCLHLIAHQDEKLIGYCRIVPPNFASNTGKMDSVVHTFNASAAGSMPAIGRVLVLPMYRGNGLARQIMIQAIQYCHKKYGKKTPITISAQTYLLDFYRSLGFVANSDFYLADGLEHVNMVLYPAKKVKAPIIQSSNTSTILNTLLLILAVLFVVGVVYLMI